MYAMKQSSSAEKDGSFAAHCCTFSSPGPTWEHHIAYQSTLRWKKQQQTHRWIMQMTDSECVLRRRGHRRWPQGLLVFARGSSTYKIHTYTPPPPSSSLLLTMNSVVTMATSVWRGGEHQSESEFSLGQMKREWEERKGGIRRRGKEEGTDSQRDGDTTRPQGTNRTERLPLTRGSMKGSPCAPHLICHAGNNSQSNVCRSPPPQQGLYLLFKTVSAGWRVDL